MSIVLSLFVLLSAAQADPADKVVAQLQGWKSDRKADSVPTIPTQIYREAFSGEIATGIEVVESIKAAKGYAVAVFDIPIETYWKAITDEDHHAGKTPVSVSFTVDGSPRTNDHTIFQYLDIPILTDRWWMVNILYNGELYTSSSGTAWELVWADRNGDTALRAKLDPKVIEDGMPVAWTKGAWMLVDLGDGRTLVEYHTWSDPGGYVPVGPATRFAAGEVADNLEQMAAFARTHTPLCKARFQRPDGSTL
jgi:hypothetical protein